MCDGEGGINYQINDGRLGGGAQRTHPGGTLGRICETGEGWPGDRLF